MAKEIEELLPRVMTYAPTCPEPMAIRHLREAAIEVCRRTKLWRDSDEFAVQMPDYEGICTNAEAEIFEIKAARLDGIMLTPVTEAWLDNKYPGWEDKTEVSAARYVTQIHPNTITVFPRATGTMRLRLILLPNAAALTLPDFLVDQYGDVIAHGAIGEILTTPNAEIANPQLGASFVARFEDELNTYALRAAKGQHGARLRTTPSFM